MEAGDKAFILTIHKFDAHTFSGLKSIEKTARF